MPVDSLVTQTVNKAAKLEPPASDRLNDMTYVVAFEDDGSARDVTQRYVKAYNAKTRKARVEATEGGQRWYNKAMKNFTTTPDVGGKLEDDALFGQHADNTARTATRSKTRNCQNARQTSLCPETYKTSKTTHTTPLSDISAAMRSSTLAVK